GATLAPLVKVAARHGISPWVSAVVLGIGLVAAGAISISLLAQPVSEWIAKAPEIGAIVRQKLYVLDRPLAAWRELTEALLLRGENSVAVEPSQLAIVTPVITL